MNAHDIILEQQRRGVFLWEERGELRYRAPKGAMTSELRSLLQQQKPEILAALRQDRQGRRIEPELGQRHEPFPLTDVQAAYLLGRHAAFGFGGVACQIYVELEFSELDRERLELAWNQLIVRHDMLRAVVDASGSQRVLAEVPHYTIRAHQAAGDASAAARQLSTIRRELGHRVRPPQRWPLFDLSISQLPQQAILHFSIDFIIADWTSIQLLLEELLLMYEGPGQVALPPLEVTFRDYVLAERALQQGADFQRDRAYWLARIDSLPGAPELPLAPAAEEDVPPRFRRFSTRLARAEWSNWKSVTASHSLTASAALLAAYAEVIGRWSRHRRFTLNLTLLNRAPLHPQVGDLVGDFTSINLLEIDNSAELSFAARTRKQAERLFSDLDHRSFGGVEVLREVARRKGREAALMPVVFTSALGAPAPGRSRAALRPRYGFGITQTPQVWIDCQVIERDGELHVNWDVREGTLRPQVVETMFEAFERLVGRLGSPETWHEVAPVQLPAEQWARRQGVNGVRGDIRDGLLHELFLDHARARPERPALLQGEQVVTYGELLARAGRVMDLLIAHDCGAGELVAVVLEKGPAQVAAVLGILLAGGAYLPIDASQPERRRAAILGDAGVRLALSSAELCQESWPEAVQVIVVDDSSAAPQPCSVPGRRVGPRERAYVIYTSGSTGTPKGATISHRSAVNTIDAINSLFQVDETAVGLGLANLGFDLSVYDVFGVLSVGGCLVLPEPARRADPAHWAALMTTNSVNLWNSVPAQLQLLVQWLAQAGAGARLPALRLALLSGDWIPLSLPGEARAFAENARFVSLGGATEAAIWSILHPIEDIDPSWKSIPYGKPLPNQSFHVLNAELGHCPDWVVGELYIGGEGLALGYHGDAAKTAERFVHHPLSGERLYRTGDLGRYMSDGGIEFLGREDQQVKIRGHRIELAEVEAALSSHPRVARAVALVQGTEALHRRLVAVVTTAGAGQAPSAAELVQHVSTLLPSYMVPQPILTLSELPLTANGKLDRRRLIELLGQPAQQPSLREAPRPGLEQQLALIWQEVLGVENVGRTDDFFQLGGDSLRAARMVGLLRERVVEASTLFFDSLVRQLLPQPTVAALAAHLVAENAAPTSAPTVQSSPLQSLGGRAGGLARVLVHDGSGRLGALGSLVPRLALRAPVLGLTIAEPRPFLKLRGAEALERRVATYARLLKAERLARAVVLGQGLGAAFALELARQLLESSVAVVGVLLLDGYRPTEAATSEQLETLWHGELAAQAERAADAAALREVFLHGAASARAHRDPYWGNVVTVCSGRLTQAAGLERVHDWPEISAASLRRLTCAGHELEGLLEQQLGEWS